MRESKSQRVRASECQNKSPLPLWERVRVRVRGNVKRLIFLLLFTVYCSLSTAVMGCGKKAPPKPPKEAALIQQIM